MKEIEHKFYAKTPKEQTNMLILFGLILGFIILGILTIAIIFKVYLLIILLAITLQIAAPFFDAPSGRKAGSLIYYSPLFIATKERKGKIIIHGGTLFDYVFTIDAKLNGAQRTKLILLGYLQGVIQLIEAFEDEGKDALQIIGTSYIINERTAHKVGLKTAKTDAGQLFILIFNYIPLMLSYSYAKGRLSFPNLFKIKTYKGTMGDLIKRKAFLQALVCRLDTDYRIDETE